MLTYALLSCVQIVFDELLPVMASMAVAAGGFGFTAVQSGSFQVVAGVAAVTTQLLIFPRATRALGPRRLFRAAMLPQVLFVLFPLLHHAAAHVAAPGALTAALAAALVVKTVSMSLSFSTVILMINNVGRGENLGLITGISQAVASTARAVSPTLGGAAFSTSIALGERLGPMWALLLTYALLSVVAAVTLCASARIPAFCDKAPDYAQVLARTAQQQAEVPEAAAAVVAVGGGDGGGGAGAGGAGNDGSGGGGGGESDELAAPSGRGRGAVV